MKKQGALKTDNSDTNEGELSNSSDHIDMNNDEINDRSSIKRHNVGMTMQDNVVKNAQAKYSYKKAPTNQIKKINNVQNFAFSNGVGDASREDDSKEGELDASMRSMNDGRKDTMKDLKHSRKGSNNSNAISKSKPYH